MHESLNLNYCSRSDPSCSHEERGAVYETSRCCKVENVLIGAQKGMKMREPSLPKKRSNETRRRIVWEVTKRPAVTQIEFAKAETVQTSTIFKHSTDLPLGKWLGGGGAALSHIGLYWKPCDQAENFLMKRLWPKETEVKVFGLKAKRYVWRKKKTAQHPGNNNPSIKCREWQHYVLAFLFRRRKWKACWHGQRGS